MSGLPFHLTPCVTAACSALSLQACAAVIMVRPCEVSSPLAWACRWALACSAWRERTAAACLAAFSALRCWTVLGVHSVLAVVACGAGCEASGGLSSGAGRKDAAAIMAIVAPAMV
nr:MAG TPA: hypothetical protein [Caudoviricetes sp.]